ncbi:MAG: MFS transporter [Actinomycetota bacterium]
MKDTPVRSDHDPPLTSRVIDRVPIHYGWVVLAAATFGMAMTIPGQTVGVSVFLDLIIDDLGLGRSAVSATYTAGTLAGSLALPFIGRAIDRHGPRRSVILIAVAFGLACAFMGLVNGLVMLLVGFSLIRGLGQGALSLVSVHSINIWFVRRRGLAVGLAGIGFAAATGVIPLGIEQLVDLFDWRLAYALLGLMVVLVMVPVGGGLFRHRPELYGLHPDSSRPPPPTEAEEVHYELSDARRTFTFWLYVAGGFSMSALGTALVFHHFSIMGTGGLDRDLAALMFVGYGFVSAGTNLATGYLIDRVPPRFLLSAALLALVASMLTATAVSTAAGVIAYGAALGTMQGMNQAIQSTVYAHYFGRIHIGAIKGLATTVTVAGAAAGPLLLAVGFDLSGSYAPVLALSATVPALLALASPFLPLRREGRVL